MNPVEYQKMRECEDLHWWYRSLHRYLLRLLPDYSGAGKRALDVGCGTGGWMAELAGLGYAVAGFDLSAEAVEYAKRRGFAEVQVGDANRFPAPDDYFDLVTCVDVMECREVDPPSVVGEMARVLKPGGYALLQMAAHQWLLSEHDVAVHSVRRYNRRQFRALFDGSGLQVIRTTYLFGLLFPLMAIWKLAHPARTGRPAAAAVSDVKLPPLPVNHLLYALCYLESLLFPDFSLPAGTSVCALVRKA